MAHVCEKFTFSLIGQHGFPGHKVSPFDRNLKLLIDEFCFGMKGFSLLLCLTEYKLGFFTFDCISYRPYYQVFEQFALGDVIVCTGFDCLNCTLFVFQSRQDNYRNLSVEFPELFDSLYSFAVRQP